MALLGTPISVISGMASRRQAAMYSSAHSGCGKVLGDIFWRIILPASLSELVRTGPVRSQKNSAIPWFFSSSNSLISVTVIQSSPTHTTRFHGNVPPSPSSTLFIAIR